MPEFRVAEGRVHAPPARLRAGRMVTRRGFVPLMLSFFVIGLYLDRRVSTERGPLPDHEHRRLDLGSWNLVIGFGIVMIGFVIPPAGADLRRSGRRAGMTRVCFPQALSTMGATLSVPSRRPPHDQQQRERRQAAPLHDHPLLARGVGQDRAAAAPPPGLPGAPATRFPGRRTQHQVDPEHATMDCIGIRSCAGPRTSRRTARRRRPRHRRRRCTGRTR